MNDLDVLLKRFEPISLQEMDNVRLMNRTDTKFMVSRTQLEDMLQHLGSNYRILEVGSIRVNRYQTLYFDTVDFRCYHQHHNGKRNRFKIRKREYVESQLSFLEYKEKTNKGRTIKSRIKLGSIAESMDEKDNAFIDAVSYTHPTLPTKREG